MLLDMWRLLLFFLRGVILTMKVYLFEFNSIRVGTEIWLGYARLGLGTRDLA